MLIRRFIVAITLCVGLSCQQDITYDVGTLSPSSEGDKTELKDDLQFMSIAYRDLFNEEVPPDVLQTMRKAYISFGDKELVIDEVVQSLLTAPGLVFPSTDDIQNDPNSFVTDTYKKFLLRNPTSFELAYWEGQLDQYPNITAQEVYYVFMTCQEYKYY